VHVLFPPLQDHSHIVTTYRSMVRSSNLDVTASQLALIRCTRAMVIAAVHSSSPASTSSKRERTFSDSTPPKMSTCERPSVSNSWGCSVTVVAVSVWNRANSGSDSNSASIGAASAGSETSDFSTGRSMAAKRFFG
jgi:hypothetical protein